MPKKDKPDLMNQRKHRPGATEQDHEQKGVVRREAETRAWANVAKLNGGGKKIATGRKIPSGPVGGSGRKTNLARSS